MRAGLFVGFFRELWRICERDIAMTIYRFIGLLGLIISQFSISASAAAGNQEALADLFSMDGRDMITAPEHLGIINGKLAIGAPGNQAGRIDGFWAPPFVSSDFALRAEILGQEVPTHVVRWWPFKLEQRGEVDGVEVSATTVLAPGLRAGLVSLALHNTTLNKLDVPLTFRTHGTLDYRDFWGFAQAKSSTATTLEAAKNILTLKAGKWAIVLRGAGDALTWDAVNGTGTQTLTLKPGATATMCLAFAIGPTAEAETACNAIAAAPVKATADAEAAHTRQVANLFQRVPRFVSGNKEVERFYNRSLVQLILNRWDVPEFVLHPYYSTGSIRGGSVTLYLWSLGESWLMMPLFDPAANAEHIKQFLKCDMTAHFAFNPVDGKAHGPWYMVNQEKIIALVYHHVRITGDTAFLDQVVDGKTILEHVLKNAVVLDDISKPVELIDYGPSGSHLELGKPGRNGYDAPDAYNHVMPDLNGRRYANYLLAAQLADVARKPAPHLRERAAALKKLFKEKLWNPETQWFDFINHKGQPETRWTVQMFYLLGSGVLDKETTTGLISHLNDQEFLGEYGLHSLAKGDPFYNPADVDNGGPGACFCFPPNIAFLLYQAGHPREAENIMRRCLWWGSRMPYWGDSVYADRLDYRHDTPLQCELDGVSVAQCFLFGMFGVDPQFDGNIRVTPRPAAFAPRTALRGVRIRDILFDIELSKTEFKVVSIGKSVTAPAGDCVAIRKRGTATEFQVMAEVKLNSP